MAAVAARCTSTISQQMIRSTPSGKKRLAYRWYIYHSPDFQFAGEGTAQNAKFAQFYNTGLLFDNSSGPVHMYNFLDWTPAQDCCVSGPGTSNVTAQEWKGKWWRAEVVVTNPDGKGLTNPGSGPVMKLYLKNVTDNTPEITAIDTSLPGTQLNPTTNFRNPPVNYFTGVQANHYRQNGGNGFEAISSYVAAAWDTDAGQRIGPAYEVEGRGN